MRLCKLIVLFAAVLVTSTLMLLPNVVADDQTPAIDSVPLDDQLAVVLREKGFTGNIEARLEERLGRPINKKRAELGQLLFFDSILSLNGDNSCAGCHSPTTGFGDTQSIAIGIDNNGAVGPARAGPRNQRRSPILINAAFYRGLMWNSRFASLSRDPFNNRNGFRFPEPEGFGLSHLPHLLAAQVFLPPTSRAEMAGFAFAGDNFAIRSELLNRLNRIKKYRKLFRKAFGIEDGQITFDMVGQAIAEFEFTLTFANAPIDRFARGDRQAMSDDQKQGALLFFGKARCVNCHAVSGDSNEMFSDFGHFVVGIPQVAPTSTNVEFDGSGKDEDYGLEQVTKNPADRYRFRTSPLRNVAVQPAYFHNGAFTTLEDAVRHYLDVFKSARSFESNRSHLAADLSERLGPIEPVLERVDSLLATPIDLATDEFNQLVEFVRNGLLDPRARPENLRKLIPASVPSGRPVQRFN